MNMSPAAIIFEFTNCFFPNLAAADRFTEQRGLQIIHDHSPAQLLRELECNR